MQSMITIDLQLKFDTANRNYFLLLNLILYKYINADVAYWTFKIIQLLEAEAWKSKSPTSYTSTFVTYTVLCIV